MKFYLSLILAKLTYLGLKILKRPATALAGYVALKICPDFLSHIKQNIKGPVINVTGTNGKTTTTGLITHILSGKNNIISNTQGANMFTGIVNTFAVNFHLFKKYDNAVIETDEAFLTKIYDYLKGDILVVTNLFNDQLDRYGDINYTQKIIADAIAKNEDIKLILNADDPKVAFLGKNKNAIYYGINDIEYIDTEIPKLTDNEIYNCNCENQLTYTKRFYAQQGHYYCTSCDFKRPECTYNAAVKIYPGYIIISLNNEYTFKINIVGLYNAYNILASICCALENGFESSDIQKALNTFKPVSGRCDTKKIYGHEVLMQLIKNAAGANEVLKTVDLSTNIMIAINNTVSDGKDDSWLWDVDFTKFKNTTNPIYVSGSCAYDVATCLKYAGIEPEKIIVIPDSKKALQTLCKNTSNNDKITLLPSYTVMWEIDKH